MFVILNDFICVTGLGCIKSSNLCTEIVEYTAPDEIAVCNLASISLPAFVDAETKTFDHDALLKIAKMVTRNLNRVIDVTMYPLPEASNSNLRHRPIGIGVQGLADVFSLLRIAFDSQEARQLNKDIFETIYFGAVTASMELAQEQGPYSSFEGSPASQGRLQFDLWDATPGIAWPWDALKKQVQEHGLRNSLLLAPMPTASTSQVLNNTECMEPISSNIFTRRTKAGSFIVVNRHLVEDLLQAGMWNKKTKDLIVAHGGSVQNIPDISGDIKALYKTCWELKQQVLIDMAADRGRYVCQSQSLNLFLVDPSFKKMSSMFFYAWKKGLKTLSYYVRIKPATQAIQFSIAPEAPDVPKVVEPLECVACGS